MSDYRVAGEWQDDLSPGESLAVPAVVWWTAREERKWLADGEWVLHWRTRWLERPRRSQHRSIDVVLGEACKLPKWNQHGEGRMFTRVTYRDFDPTAGLDPYGDDCRERLATIQREAGVTEQRDRGLRGRALKHSRAQNGHDVDVSFTEKASGLLSLAGWLAGRGEPPVPRQKEGES